MRSARRASAVRLRARHRDQRGGWIRNPTARRAFRAALALDATARHRREKPSGLYCRRRSDIVVSLKLGLASQKKGHGRPGRMETGPPARTLRIGTKEHADTHRRSACAHLQKHSAFGIGSNKFHSSQNSMMQNVIFAPRPLWLIPHASRPPVGCSKQSSESPESPMISGIPAVLDSEHLPRFSKASKVVLPSLAKEQIFRALSLALPTDNVLTCRCTKALSDSECQIGGSQFVLPNQRQDMMRLVVQKLRNCRCPFSRTDCLKKMIDLLCNTHQM